MAAVCTSQGTLHTCPGRRGSPCLHDVKRSNQIRHAGRSLIDREDGRPPHARCWTCSPESILNDGIRLPNTGKMWCSSMLCCVRGCECQSRVPDRARCPNFGAHASRGLQRMRSRQHALALWVSVEHVSRLTLVEATRMRQELLQGEPALLVRICQFKDAAVLHAEGVVKA